MMPYAQYQRIETKAGGVHCSPRDFIRAAHTLLADSAKTAANRKARHEWLRTGLANLETERRLFAKYRF